MWPLAPAAPILFSRLLWAAIACGALSSAGLAAGVTVTVTLADKGPGTFDAMTDSVPLGMAAAPRSLMADALTHADVSITIDKTGVPAGEITFKVWNRSADFAHEMLLVPVANSTTALPYDVDAMQVIEAQAGILGEVPELEPGDFGTLHLLLPAGQYVLICNLPGHYMMGMWTLFSVTASP